MIRVHTYCSYKLSPSGFQYGTFDVTNDTTEDMYYLSDENKDSIVSSAFDYGIVKRLKGRIPKKNTYIFLFKKIFFTYDSEHDDVGGDVSINMAFEFDNYNQFIAFSNEFENSEKTEPLELARSLAECIEPDISITKYKLKINKKNINDWLKGMIHNKQNDDPPKTLLITTDSEEKDLYTNDLQEIFNFDTINKKGNEVEIKHLKGAMYVYPAKKKEKLNKFPIPQQRVIKNPFVKFVIVFLAIIVMIIIIQKNNQSHTVETNQYVAEFDECKTIIPDFVTTINSDTGSHIFRIKRSL